MIPCHLLLLLLFHLYLFHMILHYIHTQIIDQVIFHLCFSSSTSFSFLNIIKLQTYSFHGFGCPGMLGEI